MEQDVIESSPDASGPSGQDSVPFPLSRPAKRKKRWRGILSTLSMFVLAPLVVVLLTTFVFQVYKVEGQSMETTLQNQDRLIIWKAPRTAARITSNHFIPHRNDIVVFTKHDLSEFEAGTSDKQLIKRIIGLPGERVVVKGGAVTVYNNEHPSGFNPATDANYGTEAGNSPGNVDITVPDNDVFVLGDNRTNSLDSPDFGTIAVDDIIGELALRIFPFNKAKGF